MSPLPKVVRNKKIRAVVRGKPPSISRQRASSIALKQVAASLIKCEVYEDLPPGYSVYWPGPKPADCWYVVCGSSNAQILDGRRSLMCISKKTGRVLLESMVGSG